MIPHPPTPTRTDTLFPSPTLYRSDRDRYLVSAGIVEITNSIRGRRWICEGRGPYEWDDEEYQLEFGAALDEIETVLNILGIVSFDKTDCTREESRVVAARAAGLELVRQWKIRKAERVRPMLAADIGLAEIGRAHV